MTEYRIVRSARKTASIQINKDLDVIVRCPYKMTDEAVNTFVGSHSSWIERNLDKMRRLQESNADSLELAPGQDIPYLGSSVTITPCLSDKSYISDGKLFITENAEPIGPVVNDFLFLEANRIIPGIVKKWSKVMGLEPKRVTITQAKTRWGSCSSSGAVCFSYRLVCAPIPLIEYVVVHELSHLVHHNHSADFHAHVEKYLSDQRSRRILLRHFQKEMSGI